MRTFVWTAWEDSSSAWCTAFPGQRPIWTCWKSRQEKLADRCLELGRQGGLLHKKYKVYLDHVGVAHVPDNYEERLTEIFPNVFQHLHLFALDPYDLALSKLERHIQRDRDDVKHLARTVPLDLEVLKVRYQKELRRQLGNPEREDLTLRLWVEAIQEET
jgi:Nucleotidyltransferase of unknown function (DUF6036)